MSNSTTSQTTTDSTYASFPGGAYMNDIAVNPTNANEFFVVFSNYQIPSIFYTSDGGKTFTNVDGNLNISGTNYHGQHHRYRSFLPLCCYRSNTQRNLIILPEPAPDYT